MADPIIKLKRSAVYGKIPTADQLPLGEVALNTYDGYLYASKNVGIGTTVIAINPFRVGTGTNTYNAYFTAGNVGIGTTIPKAKLEVNVGTAVTALDIQGSAGQLFSVTNNLTSGSIFSVNDVSGIPSIDVDADGTIQLAPYGSTEYVGIGTTNPTAKLDVNGGLNVTGVATATSFSGSGASLTSIPAGQLTGTVADARLSTVSSSKLSGALPALDGSALTGLTGASAATYGSANATPVIVVDSDGRITGISTVATAGSGSGSGNVVDDTSPQLGGNLDLNSNNITGTGNVNITGVVTATSFVKSGGTSSQFLKADGSVDSSTYITSADGGDADTVDGIEASSFLRSDAADTATGLLTLTNGLNVTSSNVGIGTDSPSSKLNVYSTDLTKVVIEGDGSSTSAASLVIQSNDTGSSFRGHGVFYYDAQSDIEWFSGRPYNGNDAFSVHRKASQTSPGDNTANRSNSLFLINSDGEVGIGTIDPQADLHIESSGPGIRLSDTGNARAFAYLDANAANAIIHADKGNTVSDSRIGFAVDNDEKARISSDGNLGIGNDNPAVALDLGKTKSTNQIKLKSSDGNVDLRINPAFGNADVASLTVVGAHPLTFHTNNTERLRITSSGNVGINSTTPTATLDVNGTLNISGVSTFQGNVNLGDDDVVNFGDGSDLQIYHDSSNNDGVIKETGTGSLILAGTNVFIRKANALENCARFVSDGTAALYYDNSQKFETTGYGVTVSGGAYVSGIATATSFESTVSTGTAPFVVASTTKVTNLNADLLDGKSTANGASGNTVVIRNAAGGFDASDVNFANITASGNLNVSGVSTFASDASFSDGAKALFGDGNDLEIYHDGGNASYIRDVGTGNLNIDSTGGNIQIRVNTNESAIVAKQDGAVDLYYDNTKKFETTSGGVTVTGTVTADGLSLGDSEYANFGADDDLQIGHVGGSFNNIQGSAELRLQSASQIQLKEYGTSEVFANFIADGAVELFHDAVKKFETTGIGVSVVGVGSTATITGPSNLVLDPGTVGDATGTVTILGNLQVDGTQTVINSSTVTVDDLNITLASGAANASAANGAGITVDGASATLTYASSGDKWVFNKAPYYNSDRLLTTADEGSGNGIDADTVDGIEASSFLRSNAADTATGDLTIEADLIVNTNTNSRFLYISRSGSTGTEYTRIGRDDLITHFHTKNDEETSTVRFRFENTDTETGGGASANTRNIDLISDATDARITIDGNRVLTTADEGSGNGIDADTVDGIEAASFLRSDAADTASGLLTLTNGLNVTGGNVGIGTDNPQANFVVSNSGNNGLEFDPENSSGTNRILSYNRNSGQRTKLEFDVSEIFVTNNTTEYLRLNSTGLGIGTDSPSTSLHVSNGISGFSGSYNGRTAAVIEGDNSSGTTLSILAKSSGYSGMFFGDEDSETSGQIQYVHSNDTFRFITDGGNEALRIDGGKVGIGTDSPDQELHVVGQIKVSASDYARVEYARNDTNLWSVGLRDTDDFIVYRESGSGNVTFPHGDVGIGTDSPTYKLHVNDTESSGAGLLVQGGGGGGPIAKFERTVGSTGTINIHSSGGDPQISFGANNTFTLGTNGSNFEICDAAAVGSNQRLVIDTSGDVGIGTDNPTSKLDVRGDTKILGGGLTINDSQTTFGYGYIKHWDNFHSIILRGVSSDTSGTPSGTNQMSFVEYGGIWNFYRTNGSVNDITVRFRYDSASWINTSGNLGIGTTNPGYKLEVAGDIKLADTGTLWFDDTSGTIEKITATTSTLDYYADGSHRFYESDNNSQKATFDVNNSSGRLYFDGDSDTYFTREATNCHVFVNAGSESVRINASGDVGIGTDSPSRKLDVFHENGTVLEVSSDFFRVNQTASSWTSATYTENPIIMWDYKSGGLGDHVFIASGGNTAVGDQMAMLISDGHGFKVGRNGYDGSDSDIDSSNEYFRITTSGDVGIGTNSPSQKLNVYNSTASDTGGVLVQNVTYTNNQDKPYLVVGTKSWTGATTNWNTYGFQHRVKSNSGGTPRITVDTATGEKFCIENGGDVGIGTNAPDAKLDVRGHIKVDEGPTLESGGSSSQLRVTTDYGYIDLGPQNSSFAHVKTDRAKFYFNKKLIVDEGIISSYDEDLIFQTDNTAEERVRILSSNGYVGINTASPSYQLHVNGSFAATTKSFVIDHPTKDGMKLRYGSLEGPENGVYVRGRLKGNDTIELPDYWTGLVDEETITVNLTPIGRKAPLHSVVDIAENTVIVESANDVVDCFYTVFGERKDVEKLEVEF